MSAATQSDEHPPVQGAAGTGASNGSLPPVTEIAVATLSLIVAGGVYLAANMPGRVSLAPAIALLGVAVALLLANAATMGRIQRFAWGRFFQVLRWTLLAYVVIAGMLAYVFLYDGVRGGTLATLLGMLAVFALDVPLVISFTVARFAAAEE